MKLITDPSLNRFLPAYLESAPFSEGENKMSLSFLLQGQGMPFLKWTEREIGRIYGDQRLLPRPHLTFGPDWYI